MYKKNKKFLLLLFLAVVMVVLVLAMLKSSLEKNSKAEHVDTSIPRCRAGPLACVHLENSHLNLVGSRQNQVLSHLGGLGWVTSHMNTSCFYKRFLKKMRSCLGEPKRLTGLAHLFMNCPLE